MSQTQCHCQCHDCDLPMTVSQAIVFLLIGYQEFAFKIPSRRSGKNNNFFLLFYFATVNLTKNTFFCMKYLLILF